MKNIKVTYERQYPLEVQYSYENMKIEYEADSLEEIEVINPKITLVCYKVSMDYLKRKREKENIKKETTNG